MFHGVLGFCRQGLRTSYAGLWYRATPSGPSIINERRDCCLIVLTHQIRSRGAKVRRGLHQSTISPAQPDSSSFVAHQ